MPDPPPIWRSLGVALRRVLPLFLATERSQVEIAFQVLPIASSPRLLTK